jgi:hypothetical protein
MTELKTTVLNGETLYPDLAAKISEAAEAAGIPFEVTTAYLLGMTTMVPTGTEKWNESERIAYQTGRHHQRYLFKIYPNDGAMR